MSEVFPNKNPILFGEAEDSIAVIDTPAVAGLTGSLVLSEDLDQGQQSDPATTDAGFPNVASRRNNGNDGNAVATFSNITTPDDSVLIIIFATCTFIQNTGSDKNWVIKRGTTILDSFEFEASSGGQVKTQLRVFIDETPTVGTHTYTVEEDDGNGFGGVVANLFFIKGTDTHGAIITAAATAIKQINSPDTHRTQQTEVIP